MVANMNQLIDDSVMFNELCKAMNLSGPYRAKVRYRKDCVLQMLPLSGNETIEACDFCGDIFTAKDLLELIDCKNESYIACKRCAEEAQHGKNY